MSILNKDINQHVNKKVYVSLKKHKQSFWINIELFTITYIYFFKNFV